MGDLTETEIFDCMVQNFRAAAEHCELLAKLPLRGPTYDALRRELKLIEGACRQAAHWREDSRWLRIGLMMNEAHQRAGHWLRKFYPRPLFLKLADNLRAGQRLAEDLRTKRPPKLGTILPEPLTPPLRQGRQVVVQLPEPADDRPKLIIPDGVTLQ